MSMKLVSIHSEIVDANQGHISEAEALKRISQILSEGTTEGAVGSARSTCCRPDASDGQARDLSHEETGDPSSGDNSIAIAARCRPVTRNAEPLTFHDWQAIEEQIYTVRRMPEIASQSDEYKADQIRMRLERFGLTVRRKSDGERSEHRADNAGSQGTGPARDVPC